MANTVFELPQGCTPLQLLQALRDHGHLRMGQWDIHLDVHGAWLTNPFGVDCALFQAVDEKGVAKLLDYIAAGAKISHEWGSL